jgi:hypothetical protein
VSEQHLLDLERGAALIGEPKTRARSTRSKQENRSELSALGEIGIGR